MADTSLKIGGGKWAVKEDSLLGYNVIQNKYVPIEMDTVRATTATRVNENGLIEVTPYNLFTYSEQFDNASWVKERITITTNATTAPNGTLTADKIVEDTTTNSHRVRQNATSEQGIQYTLSYYLKASELTKARITVGGLNAFADFDLSNGTIIGTPTLCTALIIDANNGWYRCSITYTQTSATSTAQLHLAAPLKEPAAFNYLGDGVSGIFVWGAQLVTGASAKEYFPTTDRLNIPRIDYTSGQGAILVEPQRTNLALYSEQFDNAAWNKSGSTITSNAAISPDGTTNADKLIDNITLAGHSFNSATSMVSGTTYTFSIFAKMSEIRYLTLRYISGGAFSTNYITSFDLLNGTATNSATYPASSFLITSFGNGWYKCSISQAANATGTGTYAAYLSKDGVATTYTGNGTDGLYIYGAQLELGSYPTSYIPTVASTVTRNTDVISKTGISDLIGQTEGTMFVDFNISEIEPSPSYLMVANLSNGVNVNRLGFAREPNGGVHIYVVSGGVAQFTYNTTQKTGLFKLAITYKVNDYAIYLNGTSIYTNSSASVPSSLNRFDLGNF